MPLHRSYLACLALTVIMLVGIGAGSAGAWEVQLAGMRLGQHAVNLLDIYGEPLGIVTGDGEEFASGAAAGGGAGMGGEMGMDMMGGMPGGDMGMMGAEPMMAEDPGMAMGPGEMEPGGDAMGGEGMDAGAAGGATTAGGVQRNPFPLWALPVWVTIESHEMEWLYRIDGVVIGFVLDRDGYIKSIAVAGEVCNFARTSLWRPHEYLKLGDSYKLAIYRYGWPDNTMTFDNTGPGEVGTGGGPVTVTWNGVVREFSRDCILNYDDNNNINLTFHNMELTRIHIWTHE